MQSLKPLCLTAAVAAALAGLATADGASALLESASLMRSAPNSATFQDSTGENPGGPDITQVVASNNDAGTISFEIRIPNRASLPQEILTVIYVDSDNNASTGVAEIFGADYAIEFFQGQVNLFRWDGTNFTRRAGDPPQVSLIFAATASSMTLTINSAELGATKRFSFGVVVVSGLVVNERTGDLDDTNAREDVAPDAGHGFWNYEVRTAPLRLVARRFTAPRPVAGRLHTVRLVAARSDTGAVLTGGRVRCVAAISGRRVAARTQRFVGSQARCSWLIPAAARGGTIRGSITVVFEGLSVRRSFSARIR